MRLPNFLLLQTTTTLVTLTIAAGNYPIANIDGTLLSGTFDYVLLLGSDVASATFEQAGTVTLDANGEGTISVTNTYSSGTAMILILQDQTNSNIIGAYEAEVD